MQFLRQQEAYEDFTFRQVIVLSLMNSGALSEAVHLPTEFGESSQKSVGHLFLFLFLIRSTSFIRHQHDARGQNTNNNCF